MNIKSTGAYEGLIVTFWLNYYAQIKHSHVRSLSIYLIN